MISELFDEECLREQYDLPDDVQREIHDSKMECIDETLRICREKGYLASYFEKREKEAVNMMSELLDEEYLREQYDLSERKKNFAEGMEKGLEEGKSGALKSVAEKLREMGLSEAQIKEATSV